MSLYVARCELDCRNTSPAIGKVTDFKSYTDKTRTPRKQVNMMHKTGHAEITQRFQFEVDYVVPRATNPVPFENIAGATFTVTFENEDAGQIVYGGVYTIEIGDAAVDGENEVVRKITFGAESRSEANFGTSSGDIAAVSAGAGGGTVV